MAVKVWDNHLFFTEVLARIAEGNSVRIRASGRSMMPFIRDEKDELVLAQMQENPLVGHILLVRMDNGRYIIHRVVKVDAETITLRGDGNPYGCETVKHTQILARVTGIVRGGKFIREGSWQWNAFDLLWTSNPFMRRVLLYIYKRLFLKNIDKK